MLVDELVAAMASLTGSNAAPEILGGDRGDVVVVRVGDVVAKAHPAGTDVEALAQRLEIAAAHPELMLPPLKPLQFVDDRLLKVMARFAKPFRLLTGWDISRTLKVIAPVYGLLKGVPTDSPLASAYWRKKTEIPAQMDPDRDGCGLLWCSPVVPNTGAHATAVTQLATGILLTHGFEPQISISLATERSLFCVTTISYDRHVAGEDARAAECYRVLVEELLASGYPPYRLNVSSMGYSEQEDAYTSLLRKLKTAFDPNHILAPGRYESTSPSANRESDAPAPLTVAR